MNTDQWVGRVALVTGASEGIGAAICKDLVIRGLTVLGCSRNNQGKLDALSAQLSALNAPGAFIPYTCDMGKEKDIIEMHQKIGEKYPKIHLCINNAACIHNCALENGNDANWREMIEVNVLGVCINTREALKKMEDGCGLIINMGGITGHKIPNLEGKPNTPVASLNFYHGTKFMIRGLTEGLRHEVKKRKIRVSTISPGSVQTELLQRGSSKDEAEVYFSTYRCLQPEDIVAAVVYILSTPERVNIDDIVIQPLDFLV